MHWAIGSGSHWSAVVRVCVWVATAAAAGAADGRDLGHTQQPVPPITSGVDLLTIDVQVTPSGNAVGRGLTAADFDIEVAGRKRPAVSVTLLHDDDGTVVRDTRGQADPGCVFGFHRRTDRTTAHYAIGVERIAADEREVKQVRVKVVDSAFVVESYLWRSPIARTELAQSTALARAEAQWRERGPKSYRYGVSLTCFCSPKGMNFRVIAGRSEPPRDAEAASQRLRDGYGTVERLFAMIERAIRDGAYRLEVKYDPEWGYPIWIDLDPKKEVIDDEIFLRVTGLRKLDAPTSARLAAKPLRPTG